MRLGHQEATWDGQSLEATVQVWAPARLYDLWERSARAPHVNFRGRRRKSVLTKGSAGGAAAARATHTPWPPSTISTPPAKCRRSAPSARSSVWFAQAECSCLGHPWPRARALPPVAEPQFCAGPLPPRYRPHMCTEPPPGPQAACLRRLATKAYTETIQGAGGHPQRATGGGSPGAWAPRHVPSGLRGRGAPGAAAPGAGAGGR